MPDLSSSHASRAIVTFSSTYKIEAGRLDKAIAGGINRGSLGAATAEDHENLASEVKIAITRHANKGTPLTGKLSSFAFGVARNTALKAFKRKQTDALGNLRQNEEADLALENLTSKGRSPEEAAMRLSDLRDRARLLKAALGKISESDRAALAGRLSRTEPLPRKTPVQTRAANGTAQSEKRAGDRLGRAVRVLSADMER